MQIFQWKFLCDSSDITYFRRRIGEEGFQEIFNISADIHGESAKDEDVVIDTTVQEKNIKRNKNGRYRPHHEINRSEAA